MTYFIYIFPLQVLNNQHRAFYELHILNEHKRTNKSPYISRAIILIMIIQITFAISYRSVKLIILSNQLYVKLKSTTHNILTTRSQIKIFNQTDTTTSKIYECRDIQKAFLAKHAFPRSPQLHYSPNTFHRRHLQRHRDIFVGRAPLSTLCLSQSINNIVKEQ